MAAPNEAMSAQEFGQLIAFLGQNGVAQQAAQDVLGNNPAGRTRKEITDTLRAWLKDRPKA